MADRATTAGSGRQSTRPGKALRRLAVATVVLMAQAVESGHGFGLYQRINYGISVIWVAGLALMAARDRAGSFRCDTA